MQNVLCDVTPSGYGRGSGWGLTMLATVLLSFGVGAATAAFTLMSADSPHSARFVAGETMLQLSGSPFAHETEEVRSADEIAQEVKDEVKGRAFAEYPDFRTSGEQSRYEAVGDAVSSWSDAMDDLDWRSLAPLLAAGALALLVACARGAARMLGHPRGPAVAAASTMGALLVSATLISVFGLPAMGLRAIAFAICVSVLAAKFAGVARSELIPARA